METHTHGFIGALAIGSGPTLNDRFRLFHDRKIRFEILN